MMSEPAPPGAEEPMIPGMEEEAPPGNEVAASVAYDQGGIPVDPGDAVSTGYDYAGYDPNAMSGAYDYAAAQSYWSYYGYGQQAQGYDYSGEHPLALSLREIRSEGVGALP